MKKLADIWWVWTAITLVVYYFYRDALSDLQSLIDSVSGWRGFFAGFLHGLILDLGFAGRVETATQELVSRAILWQNLFRFSFLVSAVSVGVKIHFKIQENQGKDTNNLAQSARW
jgi:hypothetical protein